MTNLTAGAGGSEDKVSPDSDAPISLTPLKIVTKSRSAYKMSDLSTEEDESRQHSGDIDIDNGVKELTASAGGKSTAKKNWEKYGKVRKACKVKKKAKPEPASEALPKSFSAIAKMEVAKQKRKKNKKPSPASVTTATPSVSASTSTTSKRRAS